MSQNAVKRTETIVGQEMYLFFSPQFLLAVFLTPVNI
jgi:hypothetical protein